MALLPGPREKITGARRRPPVVAKSLTLEFISGGKLIHAVRCPVEMGVARMNSAVINARRSALKTYSERPVVIRPLCFQSLVITVYQQPAVDDLVDYKLAAKEFRVLYLVRVVNIRNKSNIRDRIYNGRVR